jgi:hypothetical protein
MILSVAEIADTSQSTASTILNTINVIFLFLTLLCTAPFSKFWSRRLLQIQMQLCLSLLLAHVSFLILGVAKNNSPGCLPGVIIVQYLFLVVIAWSVCASVTLYDKIVNAIKSYGKQVKHKNRYCTMITPGKHPGLLFLATPSIRNDTCASSRERHNCICICSNLRLQNLENGAVHSRVRKRKITLIVLRIVEAVDWEVSAISATLSIMAKLVL